jgi:alpha,alpha-trehalase
MFQEMYYWDTYFTNVGLMLSGNVQQAKNNVDNMIYLINRFGKMPNGNRTHYLNRSQPPFLSQMVREVFDATCDLIWLEKEAYPALEREYAFWQQDRSTDNGLACYGGSFQSKAEEENFGNYFCNRAGIQKPESEETLREYSYSCVALCESGWDFTSRFLFDAHVSCGIDLNSLLYLLEKNMAYFAEKLCKTEESKVWSERADLRKKRINALLWDKERDMFCDLNTRTEKLNGLFSVASFYPLFVGLATKEQAHKTFEKLPLLECEFGIASCEDNGKLYALQWDYPHGWACLHYIMIKSLMRYGFKDDALRIAEKYVDTVTENFKTTKNLWEKYNVVTGKVSETGEYDTPPMMGWSAGIYLYCLELLK